MSCKNTDLFKLGQYVIIKPKELTRIKTFRHVFKCECVSGSTQKTENLTNKIWHSDGLVYDGVSDFYLRKYLGTRESVH